MTRQAHAVMMVVMLAALACGPAKGRNGDDTLADDDTTTADDTRADAAADSGPADDAPDVGETTADTVAADLTAGDLGPDADVSCPELWTRVPHDDAPATCELLPDPEAVSRATFDALTLSVAAPYAPPARPEDTLGTLALALHPHVVPIISDPHGVLVAASELGDGRVVAFSAQDFLSSGDRSTLLGHPGSARLVANAVGWARRGAGRVLVDNDALRSALAANGINDVDVVPTNGELRDWSGDLSSYALVAVQINEWGTQRVALADLEHLRAFVRAGGGLLVAGSALHWSWWLGAVDATFPGDTLLAGAGIAWNADAFNDLSGAVARFEPTSAPLALWRAWVDGASIGDGGYLALPSLFSSALAIGLDTDPAWHRLVAETPALPTAASSPKARLAAGVIRAVPPHRWPSLHPWAAVFPGLVRADAPRVEREVVAVERRWVGPVPLGLYAPPGEVVTVRLSTDVPGAVVRVGELHDELDGLDDVTTWERAPLTYRTFAVTARELEVGSPLGGTLYLDLPESDVTTGVIDVEVTGAVRQPLWVSDRTTPAEWLTARTLPAPQAILELPGKVRLSVRTSSLRAEDDPAAIMTYWGGFYDSHFALSQEPVPRRRASHMIFDPQVGWGYANATRERIDHPQVAEAWALRRELDSEDIWLFGHELGHQFQTADWGGGDITEVAVNLFTMFTLNGYRNGGGDRETRGFADNRIDHAALAALRWPTADLFQKLEMYRQLVFEFGWSTYQQVFASYYSPDFDRVADGEYMDGFAIRFSRIAGRDLTGFFDHWQYPLSDGARARIAALGLTPWLPPGW